VYVRQGIFLTWICLFFFVCRFLPSHGINVRDELGHPTLQKLFKFAQLFDRQTDIRTNTRPTDRQTHANTVPSSVHNIITSHV